MITKVASLRSQTRLWSRILTSYRTNGFATASPATSQDIDISQLENILNEGKQDREDHYEDLTLKFDREWNRVYQESPRAEQIGDVKKVITEIQKKRVELLAQSILELNMDETRYFTANLRSNIFRKSGVNSERSNIAWKDVQYSDIGSWPAANPNWFLQQDAIAKLWPIGEQGFGHLFAGTAPAAGTAPGGAQQAAAPKEEEKPAEEKVQEKSKFDLELAGIDASKKIAIIKEVRELLKLGLKEAKEMVEKAPVVLKRDVKKEEAEELKNKLAALGCTINLL